MGCRSFAAGILFLTTGAAFAAPPPIEAYAALPGAQSLQLSPDGDRLAMISAYKGKPVLVVRRIDGQGTPAVIDTGKTVPDWFLWKNDATLLASVRFTVSHPLVDIIEETRLVMLSPDGKESVPVKINREGPMGAVVIGDVGNRTPQIQDHIVSLLPEDPDHLLMDVTPKEDFVHPDLVRVDVHSGHPAVIQHSMPGIDEWFTNDQGQILAARKTTHETTFGKDVHRQLLVRPNPDAEWQVLSEADVDKGHRLDIAGIVGNTLYVTSDGQGGRLVARAYDLGAMQWGEVVAADQRCDVVPLHYQRHLNGFALPCVGTGFTYLDPAWQKDYLLVVKALKAQHVSIEGRSADGKRTLVSVLQTNNAPRSFWLIDRRGEKTELKWIGDSYHDIADEQIAPSKWLTYPARDGKQVPALLTLPVGYSSGVIPFVVMPHGGPTGHDVLAFDWRVQFLASRGYGVLQPQYRGSSGYGLAWQEAGYQQWGGLMQDDVTDGTRWLIGQGMAEAGKIAMVGHEYGGYAALMGVIKEPALYACAAAYDPMTDLNLMVQHQKHYAFHDLNAPHVASQGQSLDAASPVENADKIQVPVLLVHGEQDYVVPKEHSERMERAMKRKGKQVEAIYLEGGDYSLRNGNDRLAWLTALDKLLAANLPRPVQQ